MKKILALAACLAFVAALALPAFAAYAYDPDTGEFSGGSGMDSVVVTDEILDEGTFSVLLSKGSSSSASTPLLVSCPNSTPLVLSSVAAASNDWKVRNSGVDYTKDSSFPIPVSATDGSGGSNSATLTVYWGSNTQVKLIFQVPTDVPDISNMTDGQSVTITGFYGRYLPLSRKLEEGQSFTFSNVVGTPNIVLVPSSNIDITIYSATVVNITEGYTQIPSENYDYVFVGDYVGTGRTAAPYSYTLTFHDSNASDPPETDPPSPPETNPPIDLDDGLFGIVGGLADTMFSAGTSLISWATTGSNFIVLIPLSLFVLVAVVLFIRKLIKGV